MSRSSLRRSAARRRRDATSSSTRRTRSRSRCPCLRRRSNSACTSSPRSRRRSSALAANVVLRHPKLIPIPLGVANPGWPHGDADALRAARDGAEAKDRLFDVSFSVETNEAERAYCLEQIGLTLAPRVDHREYLARL